MDLPRSTGIHFFLSSFSAISFSLSQSAESTMLDIRQVPCAPALVRARAVQIGNCSDPRQQRDLLGMRCKNFGVV